MEKLDRATTFFDFHPATFVEEVDKLVSGVIADGADVLEMTIAQEAEKSDGPMSESEKTSISKVPFSFSLMKGFTKDLSCVESDPTLVLFLWFLRSSILWSSSKTHWLFSFPVELAENLSSTRMNPMLCCCFVCLCVSFVSLPSGSRLLR